MSDATEEPTEDEIPGEATNEEAEDVADEWDELPGGVRDRLETFIPDLVRRTFAAGLGALFTTEEGLRKLSKEVPMPKEVAGYLASTAGNTKDEVLRIVAREVREFLQTINLSDEIARMRTTLSFEIKTEIRFIPNDEKYTGVEPDVKAKVALKRTDKDDKDKRPGRFRRRTQAGDE